MPIDNWMAQLIRKADKALLVLWVVLVAFGLVGWVLEILIRGYITAPSG